MKFVLFATESAVILNTISIKEDHMRVTENKVPQVNEITFPLWVTCIQLHTFQCYEPIRWKKGRKKKKTRNLC